MDIKFYKNENLKYSSRKRIRDISNYDYFYANTYGSIKLGDLTETSIIVDKENICDYVTIDNTRWFVVGYDYRNGKQVELYLQRDVIGEYGVNSFYGKIERGITDSILKNRKELSLNQILKNRIKLTDSIGVSEGRGNFIVDTTKDNEMWGVLYLVRDKDGSSVNTVIDDFKVSYIDVNYDFDTETSYCISDTKSYKYEQIKIAFTNIISSGAYIANLDNRTVSFFKDSDKNTADIKLEYIGGAWSRGKEESIIKDFLSKYLNYLKSYNVEYTTSRTPQLISAENKNTVLSSVVKYSNKYYSYSLKNQSTSRFSVKSLTPNEVIMSISGDDYRVSSILKTKIFYEVYDYIVFNKNEVNSNSMGELSIPTIGNIITEPFSIAIIPLFSCNISDKNGKKWNINKQTQFKIFNSIIQQNSGGSNPRLLDAQVIPYCRNIDTVLVEFSPNNSNYSTPLFSVSSSFFVFNVAKKLYPLKDIKKEYIEREYSIVSPDNTGKYSFNFYDYTNDIKNVYGDDNINGKELNFQIKVCLKPYSVISSCNIIPESNSLYGITYQSDIRGAIPSNNGFQYTMSSNAFQTYIRENSNYQQIFNLQKEQLDKQHEVERVNEKASMTMNIISGTVMGAIGGGAVGSTFGNIGKGIGAGVGAGVAGGVIAGTMSYQYSINEKLREYEKQLLQANFDLQIGTIKNLPNTVSRISSFNEIMLQDFCFIVEVYECSDFEKSIVDKFIEKMSYSIGVVDYYTNYVKNGSFIKGNIISSDLLPALHIIASNDMNGGIYYYE